VFALFFDMKPCILEEIRSSEAGNGVRPWTLGRWTNPPERADEDTLSEWLQASDFVLGGQCRSGPLLTETGKERKKEQDKGDDEAC